MFPTKNYVSRSLELLYFMLESPQRVFAAIKTPILRELAYRRAEKKRFILY